MKERRRSKRLVPDNDVVGRVKASVPARILDISAHGVFVEIPSALRPAVECDLSVPSTEGDLRLRARVHRCRARSAAPGAQDGPNLVYRAGLEFVRLSDREARALESTYGTESRAPTEATSTKRSFGFSRLRFGSRVVRKE
jgi:hypothetical protein